MRPPARAPATFGKIGAGLFQRLIAPRLGAARTEVLVGPRVGCDCAIVRVAPGRVMALTTDPLSYLPELGPELSALLSCQLLASDLWTSAIAPAYASLDFNLPPHLGEAPFEAYWKAMAAEWERMGVAVVTGHTGRFEGCDYTIIGAGTLAGLGEESGYLTPMMAGPGDRVLVTKGCAVAAVAVAAHLIPQRLAEHLGAGGVERARGWLHRMTVVPDCRAVLRAGVRHAGVTALHDATEGGVLGGLVELALACGRTLRAERAPIPLAAEARAACAALGGLDPYWTMSEGTLIAAVRPQRTPEALAALAADGIQAAEVGEVVDGPPALELREPDGRITTYAAPLPDPYWAAYQRAVREGWS